MSRLPQLRLAPHAVLLVAALGLCAVGATSAGGATGETVRARLAPVSPAKHGSGSLTASGGSGQTVVVRWQLSVSNLSGPVRRVTLQTPGANRRTFALCQPCGAKAHGRLVLIGSMWRRIVADGGTVVVSTRAHPRGELRGPVKPA